MNPREFQELVWHQGRQLFRDMPWRQDTAPYRILVSELMLQQTQVDRVIPKFLLFMNRFPTVDALAAASLADVLRLWSGLGYNRRAKFLHDAAKQLVAEHDGHLPRQKDVLLSLPGVGSNTAGAIQAYGFNLPAVFVETNIRTVYFHHYFHDQALVSDKELLELVEATLDTEHPREWYWAMMDYGSWLKKQGGGRLEKSVHYKKQPPLKGSIREVRGQILKLLAEQPLTERELSGRLPADGRTRPAIDGLVKDGLISLIDGRLHFTR